ncbi:MAG TPA: peptidoglycan-associated lipoprotein Pal [Myxococcota bacterium]|nr:peptidoglycan-associated lipoprotein Pal [Myxococcota bacterium]
MRVKSLFWTSILIATVSFAGACATKKTEPAPAATNTEFSGDTGGTAPTTTTPIAELETVYFDYDQSVIRDDQRATLGTNAGTIKSRNLSRFTIEGHCDERGSDEYNLALGERRANAVKQYLVDSGVSATIDTVSYGESRPAVQGSDESAWRMNRRAEFVNEQ